MAKSAVPPQHHPHRDPRPGRRRSATTRRQQLGVCVLLWMLATVLHIALWEATVAVLRWVG